MAPQKFAVRGAAASSRRSRAPPRGTAPRSRPRARARPLPPSARSRRPRALPPYRIPREHRGPPLILPYRTPRGYQGPPRGIGGTPHVPAVPDPQGYRGTPLPSQTPREHWGTPSARCGTPHPCVPPQSLGPRGLHQLQGGGVEALPWGRLDRRGGADPPSPHLPRRGCHRCRGTGTCLAPPPFPGWAGSGGAGPGGDGGRRRDADRAAAAAGGSGGAGPGPGLAGGPGAAVPRVPGPLRAAELLGGGATALPCPPAALHGPDRLDLPRRLQVRVHVADGAALHPGRAQGAPVPRQVALLAVPVLPGAGLRLRLLPQRPGQLPHAAALQGRRAPRLAHVPHLRRLRLGLLKRLVLVHRFPHAGHGRDGETGLFLRLGRRPALRVPLLRQDAGAAAASLNQHLQGLSPPLPRLPHLLPDSCPLRLRLQHGCQRGDRAGEPGVVAAVVPAEPPAPAARLEVRGRGAAAAGAGAARAARLPPPALGAGCPRALAHRHHPPQHPLLQFPGGRQPLPPEGQLQPLQSGLELPGGERGPLHPPGLLPCPVPREPPAPPGLLPHVAF